VGGLDWVPNENGLRWFLESVLPLVLKERPDVEVAVLARGAASRQWVAAHPAVRLMSQDVHPAELFAGSRLSLAPLLEGGGVRIKILESLAVGCPAVATTIGGEGLESDGLWVADAPEDFAAACLRILAMPPEAAVREGWRKGLGERHSAQAVALQLVEIWRRVEAG
jgi:glycosyltransferase involved in cell wall biosynthesis